jgi:hypothetical protein
VSRISLCIHHTPGTRYLQQSHSQIEATDSTASLGFNFAWSAA